MTNMHSLKKVSYDLTFQQAEEIHDALAPLATGYPSPAAGLRGALWEGVIAPANRIEVSVTVVYNA